MKRIAMLALLVMFGLAGKSFAVSITATISSTSFATGANRSDILLLNPKESLTYTLTGSATGRMLLEKSIDGSNFVAIISSQNNSGGLRTGIEYSNDMTAFYRWRASTMTNAGSFVVTLDDNDDFVGEFINNKKVAALQIWDDTIRLLSSKGMSMASIIPSTATTSGNSLGNVYPVWLTGTLNAFEGSVLIATAPVAGRGVSVIVAPATTGLSSHVGISKSSSAVNAQIEMYTDGFVLALTTGVVIPGDILGTSGSTAGYLQTLTTSSQTVAIAFGNGITAGGRLKVRMRW